MEGPADLRWLGSALGWFSLGLMALLLLDGFLTVLYARVRIGPVSHCVARPTGGSSVGFPGPFGRHRGLVLAACGPAVLVLIIAVWALRLTLGSAGLVRGRRLTSWPGIKDDVRNASGVWVDAEVVRDRNWVSSRGPQDLRAFDKAVVEHFAEGAGRSGRAAPAEGSDGSWQRLIAGGVAAATRPDGAAPGRAESGDARQGGGSRGAIACAAAARPVVRYEG